MSILYKNSPVKESSELRRVQLQQDDDAVKKMDFMYDSDTRTPIYESYVRSSCSMFDDDNDKGKQTDSNEDGTQRVSVFPVTPVSLDLKTELNGSESGDPLQRQQQESASTSTDLNSIFRPLDNFNNKKNKKEKENFFLLSSSDQSETRDYTAGTGAAGHADAVVVDVKRRCRASDSDSNSDIDSDEHDDDDGDEDNEEEATQMMKMKQYEDFLDVIESKFPECVVQEQPSPPSVRGHDFNADELAKEILEKHRELETAGVLATSTLLNSAKENSTFNI